MRYQVFPWSQHYYLLNFRKFYLAVLFSFCGLFAQTFVVHCMESPMFVKSISNVTVQIGREAILECVVQNLNTYKVAWLRVDTQTILTIHSHVITKNHRIGVTHVDEEIWDLHIKDVQKSDKGWYMCQINTDPMLSQVGYLDVVAIPVSVSPDILDFPTSSDKVVDENSDVKLQCAATGSPKPIITWKREDLLPIVLANGTEAYNITGDYLNFVRIKRDQMGTYICIASNGIPPTVTKRISLLVQFPPSVRVVLQLIGAYEGEKVILECHSQAFPKAISYWAKENGEIILHSDKFVPEIITDSYKVHMILTINYLSERNFGIYKCISKNSLGDMEGSVNVYKIHHKNLEFPSNDLSATSDDKTVDLIHRLENKEEETVRKLLRDDGTQYNSSNNFQPIGFNTLMGLFPLLQLAVFHFKFFLLLN